MFNLQESATAYAKAAERILGNDSLFLDEHAEVVPVFVALLFQSVEISVKHLGIESCLFTGKEVKGKNQPCNGHSVKEIADLANERLGADKSYPVITALTAGMKNDGKTEIIQKMIFGREFEYTRQSYQSRNLGYLQIQQADFAVVEGLKPWVKVVRQVAENLPTGINLVTQWKSSPSNSKNFGIWFSSVNGM